MPASDKYCPLPKTPPSDSIFSLSSKGFSLSTLPKRLPRRNLLRHRPIHETATLILARRLLAATAAGWGESQRLWPWAFRLRAPLSSPALPPPPLSGYLLPFVAPLPLYLLPITPFRLCEKTSKGIYIYIYIYECLVFVAFYVVWIFSLMGYVGLF